MYGVRSKVGSFQEQRDHDKNMPQLISQIDTGLPEVIKDRTLDTLYLGYQKLVPDDPQEYAHKRSSNDHPVGSGICGPFPYRSIMAIEKDSVNSIRSEFNAAIKMGFELVQIRLDTLKPGNTPESRARMGVYIVQIASFSKKNIIISLPPGRFGGKVDEISLPELVRLDLLMMMASQGFAWLELEDDIPLSEMTEIIKRAHGSGTKVLLSRYHGSADNWVPPSPGVQQMIDGYRLRISVSSGKELKKFLRTCGLIRSTLKNKSKMIDLKNSIADDLRWLTPFLGSDNLVMGPMTDPDLHNHGGMRYGCEPAMEFWRRTGLVGEGVGKEWSLQDRCIDSNTRIMARIGGEGGNDLMMRVHNSIFKRNDNNAVILPWQVSKKDVNGFFRMAKDLELCGIMVDKPFNSTALWNMDDTDPASRKVGAVNLVLGNRGKLSGYNTEIYAMTDILKENVGIDGGKVLVLGCGPSGRSAAMASHIIGCDTTISVSSTDRIEDLSISLGIPLEVVSYKELGEPGRRYDVIINTLPSGFFFETGRGRMSIPGLVGRMSHTIGIEMSRSNVVTPFLSSLRTNGNKTHPVTEMMVRTAIIDQKLLLDQDIMDDMVRDLISGL
ncbi:MAG: hypothetical protein JXA22_04555 [Candidatus Thermoplasmatota archaeon]|nr:hypothetical protein [Candidatus Thermoplasmatota archaeon]